MSHPTHAAKRLVRFLTHRGLPEMWAKIIAGAIIGAAIAAGVLVKNNDAPAEGNGTVIQAAGTEP